MTSATTRAGLRSAVTVLLGAALVPVAAGTLSASAGPASARADVTAPRCGTSERSFVPTTLAIDGLLAPARILRRGRDDAGVPKPPPLTEAGKWQLAWDGASRVRPGDPTGVVRLTAHTYPRPRPRADRAPALGNLLLDRLRPGARIVVRGSDGDRLCYRVTRRQRARADDSLSGYYDTAGAPRLAILVCSGTRRGPGDWSHRTIWWARPAHPATQPPDL